MTPEQVFTGANTIAATSWLLLAVLPRHRWVTAVVAGRFVPGLFAILYVAIIVPLFARTEGGFSSLAGVSALFSNPWLLLAGWVHYLAFDLLIGAWEVRDAQRRGLSHLFVLPCLLLTFVFGPAGWLLYLALRSALGARPMAATTAH